MAEINLTQGRVALIDDADFEQVNKFKWQYWTDCKAQHLQGYAIRTDRSGEKRKTVALHQFLMNAPKGMQVDHINGDTLDNRRENLQIITQAQNQYKKRIQRNNTTGFRGVWFNRENKKFRASIRHERKRKHLGYFEKAIDAAKAYDTAAVEAFGRFASLNFPSEELMPMKASLA